MKKTNIKLSSLCFFIMMFILQCSKVNGHNHNSINSAKRLMTEYSQSNSPEQIHLSLGSQSHSIVVMWSTKLEEECFIEYGNGPENLKSVTATMAQLTVDNEQASQYLHRAELLDLKPGDIAYNLNTEGGSIGDHFMRRVSKFTSSIPYMTTPGDHERAHSFYHYRYRFSMPNAPWPMSEDSLWYSLNIGYTHFISINTEYFYLQSAYKQLQIDWLKKDLTEANKLRDSVPWIIVMAHKPLYCTKSEMEQECQEENSYLRDSLEDLFFEHGVDLIISGHKHCYERSWPMYMSRAFQLNYINPLAPIYIVIGAMGYEYMADKQKSSPFWLAFAMSDTEKELFARLNVVNKTHLVWSVHASMTNEDVDDVQVIQTKHGSFGKPGAKALEKMKPRTGGSRNLPPEPFHFVDATNIDYQYRPFILSATVFTISFVLFLFLRHSKVRKVLRL
ncbi:acid phosphatase type 7-like isoform X3 [Biomphalaria glabrata]|uniref:Purple acid phosphatase n=1 Tax=Biomphalaria glabrata TaxID=6526 RepID=A0A9W3A802_BIOGL|nr:acid phosphatase type 7-like isoform X3 [Biomphalaria glabrata]